MSDLRKKYSDDGYVVVPTGLPKATLESAKECLGPLQPDGYHWSEGPRIFEAWRDSQAVRDIAWCDAVTGAIREATGESSRPFQTINFSKGTNQKLHQDAVHFQTLPLGRVVGAWVALEDMDEDNGTLCFVPGSHKMGFIEWELGKYKPGEQFDAYGVYEEIIERLEEKPVSLVCQAGDAIIWHLDLLHGGLPIKDQSRTRHSQATHYFLESCKIGWAPMFSDPKTYDYCFKSTRWFDRSGVRREWHERDEVTLY